MLVGGTANTIAAVRATGRQPGPMTAWVTGGAINWGTGNLDTHYAACKAAGVTPLIQFWFWGDDIGTDAILHGVKDRFQGTWKTRAIALGLAKTIGEKATQAGVSPIVVIEHEFAQNGLDVDSSAFGPYFLDAAAAVKAACPTARIAFCCPIWEDEVAIARIYAPQIAKADIIASQTLLFPPRHAAREFTNAGANLALAFTNLRAAAPGKPAAIVDLGFSSYGGPYANTEPFLGGNGTANEPLQAAALQSIADRVGSMGLEFLIYRDMRDNPSFAVANYGGYAERYVGVIRSDGTPKPARDILIGMASPAPPPAPTPLQTCQAQVASLSTQVSMLSGQRDAASAARDAATAALTSLKSRITTALNS